MHSSEHLFGVGHARGRWPNALLGALSGTPVEGLDRNSILTLVLYQLGSAAGVVRGGWGWSLTCFHGLEMKEDSRESEICGRTRQN